jgi:riboflavin kinase / FMN adenylyltransferase
VRILSWEELGEGHLSGRPFAATIGVFDGLHIGHRVLVDKVVGREGLASAVLTFKENPKRILSPATFQGELTTLDQKLGLIESLGADFCVLIDFSGDFSKLPGRRFLSMLKDCGELRLLAVGSDFRCGHALDTDAEGIREFCEERSIDAELLRAVSWAGHPVSSSRIRKAVLDGRLEDAAAMLGRPYELDLRASALSPGGYAAMAGSQVRPPSGTYEAELAFRDGTGARVSPVAARLGAGGAWSVSGKAAGGEPSGLRLIRLVSRE